MRNIHQLSERKICKVCARICGLAMMPSPLRGRVFTTNNATHVAPLVDFTQPGRRSCYSSRDLGSGVRHGAAHQCFWALWKHQVLISVRASPFWAAFFIINIYMPLLGSSYWWEGDVGTHLRRSQLRCPGIPTVPVVGPVRESAERLTKGNLGPFLPTATPACSQGWKTRQGCSLELSLKSQTRVDASQGWTRVDAS